MIKVTKYIVSRGASSKPSVCRYTAPPIDGSLPQKKQRAMHVLARVDSNGDQPSVDQQQAQACSGMQACLNQDGECREVYYQSTYLDPPSKSVINYIIVKNVECMM